MDNFLISFKQAKKLQKEGTSIVGTVRASSKYLRKKIIGSVKGGKYSSKFYYEKYCKYMLVNINVKTRSLFAFYQPHMHLLLFQVEKGRNRMLFNFITKPRSKSTFLTRWLECIQEYARHNVGLLACGVMF